MEQSLEIVTWILCVLSLMILPVGFLWRIIRSRKYPSAWKLVFASCDIAHFLLALGIVLSLTAPDDQAALSCRMAGFLMLFGCQDAVWSIVVYDIVFLWISFPLKETHSAKSSYQRNVVLIILIPQKLFQTVLVILPLTSLEYFDNATPYLTKCLPFRGIHSNGSAYFLLINVLMWVAILTALVFLCVTFLKIQRARLTRVHSSADIPNLCNHVRYATIVLRLSILEHIMLFVSCLILTLAIYSDTYIQLDSTLLCFALTSFVKALISITCSWYGDNRTWCTKRKPRALDPVEPDRTLRKLEHIGTKHGIVSLKCTWTDAGRQDVKEGLLKVYEPDKLKLWAHEIVVLGMLRSRQFPGLLKCQWTDSSNSYSDAISLISGEDVSPSSRLICVDFMNLGSLSDVLPRLTAPLSDLCLLSLVSDVAEGLSYLHSLSILHNRLYLKNIFIRGTIETQNLSASIGNFEHSEVVSPLLPNDTENSLPDNWLIDPIVVEVDNSESFRFDIRAFGLVILESVILNCLLKKSSINPSASIFKPTQNSASRRQLETTSESAPFTTYGRTCGESGSKETNNLPDVLLVKRVVTENGHNGNEYCTNGSNNIDLRHSEGQCNSKSTSNGSGSESWKHKTLHEKEHKTSSVNVNKPTPSKETILESIVRSKFPIVQKHAAINSQLNAEDIIKNCGKPKKDYMVELVSRYDESTSVSHCNTNYTTGLSKALSKKHSSCQKQQSDNSHQREDVDLLALICQDSVAALINSISEKYPAEVTSSFQETTPHDAGLTINHQRGVQEAVMNVKNKSDHDFKKANKPLKDQTKLTGNDDPKIVPDVKSHFSNKSLHSFHNGTPNNETVPIPYAKSKIHSTCNSAFTRVVKATDVTNPFDSGNKCQLYSRENIQPNTTVNGSHDLSSEISQKLARELVPDVVSNVLQGDTRATHTPSDNQICPDVANEVVHDVNSNVRTDLAKEILNCDKSTVTVSSNKEVVSDTTSSIQNNSLKIPSDLSNRERILKQQSLKMNRARRQLKAAVKIRTVSRLIKTTRSLERTRDRNTRSDNPLDRYSNQSQGLEIKDNTIKDNQCNTQNSQNISCHSISTQDGQTLTQTSNKLAENYLLTASIELDHSCDSTNSATSDSISSVKVMDIPDINTIQKCNEVKCISPGNVDFKRNSPFASPNTHAGHNNTMLDTVCPRTNLFQSLDSSQARNIENLTESRICHFDEFQAKNCENVAESHDDCFHGNQVKNDKKRFECSSYNFDEIQVINCKNRVDSHGYLFDETRINETEDKCKPVHEDQIQAKNHKRGVESHVYHSHGVQSNNDENSIKSQSNHVHGSQNKNIETGIYFDGIQTQNGANGVESHHAHYGGIEANIGEQDVDTSAYFNDETPSRKCETDVKSHSCHFNENHPTNGDKAAQYGRKPHLNNSVSIKSPIFTSSDKCTGIKQTASCHARTTHTSGKQVQKIYGKYNSVIFDSELIIGRLRGIAASTNIETQNTAKYGDPVSPHSQECQTNVSTLHCTQDETDGEISDFLRKRCEKLSSNLIPIQDLLPVTDDGVRRIIERLAHIVDLSIVDGRLLEAFDRCWSFAEPVPSAADISRFLHQLILDTP